MDINYNKTDFISLVEKYYLEKEGRQVKINVDSKKGCVGFFETLGCITTINLSESAEFLGKKTTISEVLNRDNIRNIFNQMLEGSGYRLVDFQYEDGLKQKCIGYGSSEHMTYEPYFNGIKLSVERVKTLVMKG